MKKEYNRVIIFRDADGCKRNIKISIEQGDQIEKRSYEDLSIKSIYYKLSMSGDGGQEQDSIKPAYAAQKSLLDIWNVYHLNDMACGTEVQEGLLETKQYEKFCKLLSGIREDMKTQKKTELVDFASSLGAKMKSGANMDVLPVYSDMILGVLAVKIFEFIMKLSVEQVEKGHDYSQRSVFLELNGLLEDRGYKYGSAWLLRPISFEDMAAKIENICDKIQEEEDARKSAKQSVSDVSDINDMDESDGHQAEQDLGIKWFKFIALGIHLGISYQEIIDDIQAEAGRDERFFNYGQQSFYVVTEEEAIEETRDYYGDEGKYFWKQAVEAGNTKKGLEDWLDELAGNAEDRKGVLASYDGHDHEVKVNNELYHIYRCN